VDHPGVGLSVWRSCHFLAPETTHRQAFGIAQHAQVTDRRQLPVLDYYVWCGLPYRRGLEIAKTLGMGAVVYCEV
jgi:hypothetical protein